MEGVCLVMGVEAVRYKAKDGVTMLKDFWATATGKSVLSNPRLVEILSSLDSTTITTVRTLYKDNYLLSRIQWQV